MNPLINGLNTLLKTGYIAVLIKVLFEFTGFFKLQIVINNLFSFNTGFFVYKTRQDNALFGVLYSPLYTDFIQII